MKRTRNKAHVNHERWLVSYADFITLLFAFFVVLFAASQSDKKKQTQLAGAIDSAFRSLGLFPASGKKAEPAAAPTAPPSANLYPVVPLPAEPADEPLAAPAGVHQDFEQIRRHLSGLLAGEIAAHAVSVHIGRDGLIISLREAGFYDSGSAAPHPGSTDTLNQIAQVLALTPYDIRIEGHTDNIPIHTAQFESNWELSTARATTLAKFFIVDRHLAPQRLSASGYAEFHPVADNATSEGRSANRRVDIILLPRSSVDDGPGLRAGPAALAAAIANAKGTTQAASKAPASPPAKPSAMRPAPSR
jgi:chemotaxis protein MotB